MGKLLNIQAITTAAGDLSRFVPYGEIVKQDIDVAIRWANWFPSPMGCLLNLYICLTINVIGVFRPLWGNC